MIASKWILGTYDESFELSRLIREKVFVEEQKVEPDREMDEYDKYAVHLLIFSDDTPVATGRLYHDNTHVKIGRIAVLAEHRGQGLGDLVIRLLLYKASQTDTKEIYVLAQTYIYKMYEKFGFALVNEDIIIKDNLPHYEMVLNMKDLKFPSKCGKIN